MSGLPSARRVWRTDDTPSAVRPQRPTPGHAAGERIARVCSGVMRDGDDFWYSVVTTGIYCRPGCPTRRPRPENVRIHETLEEARATGFRPCRRCDHQAPSPAQRNRDRILAACLRLETDDPRPSADRLAREVGVSTAYFHRLFRAVTGTTPAAWARRSRVPGRMNPAGAVHAPPATRSAAGLPFPPESGRCGSASSVPTCR